MEQFSSGDPGQSHRWHGSVVVAWSVLVACLWAVLTLPAIAQAAGEYEPNDGRDNAYGPLAGGTEYTATFETANDTDWYVFYVKTYSQMDVSAEKISNVEEFCEFSTVQLYDKDGNVVRSGSTNMSSGLATNHIHVTLSPGRYYFQALRDQACVGDRYRFRIEPASAITTSQDCGEAIVTRETVTPLVGPLNEKLARNGESLAEKVQSVNEAKKRLRHAAKKAQRLHRKTKRLEKQLRKRKRLGNRAARRRMSKRHLALRRKLVQLQAETRRARDRLNEAKAARSPVWSEKVNLEALSQQYQRELSGAEGQIASSC